MILFFRHFKKCCLLANVSSTNNLRSFSLYRSLLRNNEKFLIQHQLRSFHGGRVNFCKIQNIAKAPKPKKSEYKRLLALAKNEKWKILAGVSFLFVSSGITMLVPFSLGKILDIIYSAGTDNNEAKQKLEKLCLTLCGIFIIGGMANFARVYLFNNASIRITRDLRSKLYKSILNQETAFFDKRSTGELISRLSADVNTVGNSLSVNISDFLRNSVMVGASCTMMYVTSPILSLFSLCVVPCLAGMAIVYGRFVRKITKLFTDEVAQVMKTGEEKISNVKTVKMFGKEGFELKLFNEKLENALKIGYRETKARAIFYGMTGLSGNCIIVSVLYYGGTMVANNELTIGALTSFLLYAAYSAISIGGLSSFYTDINKSIGSATRIWEIMDREYKIPNVGLIPITKPKGLIEFRDVEFSYPTRDNAQILKGFNLTLKSGTRTAIVGRSGTGKSTIASLVLRLYDPQSGTIKLDGVDIRDLHPQWLRREIGIVNQEPTLFSGTIRENILYGLDSEADFNEDLLQRTLKDAHVDEIISKLPDGLETVVGQRGTTLSGGQRQRIALARALIKNPQILILDEATSSLDSVSENLIQSSILKFSEGRTVLIIAHRLSTIASADAIAVLQNGQICEYGSFDELMKVDGTFNKLVQNQNFSKI
ncbi:ATP-binding cassette sub-family B member 10, mitochondrial [Culicoides brevitarsis]|uniref:ATP-binding cassette sub-family B member 10, mitochondrial n=1 Tax=Culicoides brevitarsis TaxID=469753 RepID=UPI00307C22B2